MQIKSSKLNPKIKGSNLYPKIKDDMLNNENQHGDQKETLQDSIVPKILIFNVTIVTKQLLLLIKSTS